MPQNFCVSHGGELSSLLGILVRKVNHLQTKAALYPRLFKDPVIIVQPSFELAVSYSWTRVYTIEPTRQPFKKVSMINSSWTFWLLFLTHFSLKKLNTLSILLFCSAKWPHWWYGRKTAWKLRSWGVFKLMCALSG